jgi:hypothetical protein
MRTLKALVMMAALAAVVVPATAGAADKVRAYIPFEFTVGAETLPAGNYHFQNQNTPQAMIVGSLDRQAQVMVIARPVYAPAGTRIESRVVFNKYGNRYFLAKVWNASSGMGAGVNKSRQERETSQKASAQTVLVAAR